MKSNGGSDPRELESLFSSSDGSKMGMIEAGQAGSSHISSIKEWNILPQIQDTLLRQQSQNPLLISPITIST